MAAPASGADLVELAPEEDTSLFFSDASSPAKSSDSGDAWSRAAAEAAAVAPATDTAAAPAATAVVASPQLRRGASSSPHLRRGAAPGVPGRGVSPGSTAHLYVFTAEKGGMKGFDRELQQRVIEELSTGSKHLEHARRQDEKCTARIEAVRAAVRELTPGQLADHTRAAQRQAAEFEKERTSDRWCAVVDMDMFYAAIVIKDKPHLRDKPVAVGGMSMLSTSNYVARRYGVRAAMPGFIAKELCARQGVELVFEHLSGTRRREESKASQGVMARYGTISAMSDDEARIDLTPRVRAAHAAGAAATEEACAAQVLAALRKEIYDVTGLTASGSVAPNFLLAKIGADVNKPNGQFVFPRTREGVLEWLTPLAVRKIPFVGRVSERVLKEGVGLHTVGDVLGNMGMVAAGFGSKGKSSGHLIKSCLGIGSDSLVDYSSKPEDAVLRHTIGVERTFRDMTDPAQMFEVLQKLCEKVDAAAAKENVDGRAVTLKLKLTSFAVLTRGTSAPTHVRTKEDIYPLAAALLQKELDATPALSLRLMGVRLGQFKQHISRAAASDKSQRRLLQFFGKPDPAADGAPAPAPAPATGGCEDEEEDVCIVVPPPSSNPPAKRRRQQQQRLAGASVDDAIEID